MEKAKKLKKFGLWGIAITWALALARSVYFIMHFRSPVFFQDLWGFYTPILNEKGLVEVFFWQHGSHFAGLGNLVSQLLYTCLGPNPQAESWTVLALMNLNVYVFISLKQKISGTLNWADFLIPLMFLNLHQLEVFGWLAHSSVVAMPLLLLGLSGHLLLMEEKKMRSLYFFLLTFLSLFTGYTFLWAPFLIIASAYHVYRHTTTHAMLALSAQLMALAIFFWMYKWPNTQVCTPQSNDFLVYMRDLSLNFFGGLEHRKLSYFYLGMGLTIPVALLYKTRLPKPAASKQRILLSLLAFSTLYALMNTYGRHCLEVPAARAPRYTSFLLPGFFTLYTYLALWGQNAVNKRHRFLAMLFFVGTYSFLELREDPRIISIASQRETYAKKWFACYCEKKSRQLCPTNQGRDPLPPRLEHYQKAIAVYFEKKCRY